MKRRTLILSGLGAAGALVVGWSLLPQRSRMGAGDLMQPAQGEVALNGWLKIAQDGSIIMAMPRSEMGQGVHTALPQLVAEELDVPLAQVRISQAGSDRLYGNVAMFVASLPFHPRQDGSTLVKTSEWMTGKLARELGVVVTGGSSSVSDAWGSVRLAAATARAQLAQAAASKLGVAPESLQFEGGKISGGSGRCGGCEGRRCQAQRGQGIQTDWQDAAAQRCASESQWHGAVWPGCALARHGLCCGQTQPHDRRLARQL
jgi:isoquinoline 1-oxidoreductase subunit beta